MIISIDQSIIEKKTINNVGEGFVVIRNNLGTSTIDNVNPIREKPNAKPFTSEKGKHKVTKFKNPV